MKLRDTIILVVLAHVGLVLVWVCMGGCANKGEEPKKEVAALTSEEKAAELPPARTEKTTREPSIPIVVEEAREPGAVTLPQTAPTTPAAEAAETEPAPQEIKVTVKKGDTLWALSRKYHVPVSAIVDRNDIQKPELIREGRELIIPVGPSAKKAEPKAESAPAEGAAALPAGSEAVPVAQDAQTTMHVVGPGDTLWSLARKYGTTSGKIMEANNVTDPTKLQIGQELRIPKAN